MAENVAKKKRAETRLNQAPLKLKLLIDRVNWLPAWMGTEMPYFTAITMNTMLEHKHTALYKALDELTAEGKKLAQEAQDHRRKPERDVDDIEERVAQLTQYVLGDMVLKENPERQAKLSNFDPSQYEDSLQEAVSRYVSFIYIRMQLRTLVRLKEKIDKLSIYRPANPIKFSIERKGHIRSLRFQIEPDELLDALDGVEIDRLRECKVCRRLFWAGRKDQMCCPLRPSLRTCGNVYRQRLLRREQK